jgi:hypothetical protein
MVSRFPASLLLLVCATALSQTPDPPASNLPKSFHDPSLNITYFYPGRFTPAAPAPKAAEAAVPLCAQSTLSASSATPVSTSVFVLSTIDNTCPKILLGAATDLGAFAREQILRQLKAYGDPVITQEPSHYTIEGHPAVITLASAKPTTKLGPNDLTPAKTTYAAKACLLGSIPAKPRKRTDPVEPVKHVLCFDFTTQDKGLIPLMFGFSMEFDDHGPQPLVPGSVIR